MSDILRFPVDNYTMSARNKGGSGFPGGGPGGPPGGHCADDDTEGFMI